MVSLIFDYFNKFSDGYSEVNFWLFSINLFGYGKINF